MSNDIADIEAVLQTYFDGLYEGDTDTIAAAFHPTSSLFSAADGKLAELPRTQWLEAVKTRASAKSQGLARRDWIVSIDRSGPNTAFAKVQCQIPPRYFTDYLTLVKLADGWQIVSKTFHADTK